MKNLSIYLLIVAVVFTSTFFFIAPEAHALSCSAESASLEKQIANADAIFSGKVTRIQTGAPTRADNVSFEVIEFWKGTVYKKEIVGGIYAWTGMTNPPPFFKIGETYLVFAKSTPNSEYSKNINNFYVATIDCGRTKLLSNVSEEKAVLGQGKVPLSTSMYSFSRNLTLGSRGNDVSVLQTILETSGFLVMPPGVPEGYFGNLTKTALAKYQQSVNIFPAVGYFGPLTRLSVNQGEIIFLGNAL